MKATKQKWVPWVLATVGLMLAAVECIMLPNTVAMQVNFANEASNFMPRILGLAILTGIVCWFAYRYHTERENGKHLVGAAMGLLGFGALFWMNLSWKMNEMERNIGKPRNKVSWWFL